MAKKRAAAVFESLFETSGLMQYLHMKTDPLMDSNISISQLKILGCLFRQRVGFHMQILHQSGSLKQ